MSASRSLVLLTTRSSFMQEALDTASELRKMKKLMQKSLWRKTDMAKLRSAAQEMGLKRL